MGKRHEHEIREILNRMDRFLPDEQQRPRQPRRAGQRHTLSPFLHPMKNPERLMLAGLVLVMLAGFTPSLLSWISPRGFAQVAAGLGLLGLALLLAGYALCIVRARRSPPERRWRGQVIRFAPRFEGPYSSTQYRWWQIRMSLRRWLRLW